jgi:transposase
MSKKKYRQFSEAFKKDALDLLEHSGKTMAQIERDLGISPGLLGKWKQRYKIDETSQKLTASDTAAGQKEIQHLKRELDLARMERDILKKAISIFSQEDKKE